MTVKNPGVLGELACPECKSHYIRVVLLNMGLSPGIDHLDFYCHVCKRFVSHLNAVPYVDPDVEQLNKELNEELEKS